MVLRSVEIWSAAKVMGAMYFVIGLLAALFMAVMAALGGNADNALAGVALIVMIVIMPALYAIGGFIGGAIMALLYNFVVQFTGGIELDFEPKPPGI